MMAEGGESEEAADIMTAEGGESEKEIIAIVVASSIASLHLPFSMRLGFSPFGPFQMPQE